MPTRRLAIATPLLALRVSALPVLAFRVLALPVLALPVRARPVRAQQARPLRVVVPFPAGGAADSLGRVVGERVGRALGQPAAVENRTGAGGNVGTAAAAQGDANTVLLNSAPLAVNRFLFAQPPFDAERDFAAIGMIAVVPNIMVVPTALPVTSVAGFAALAHASGPASYASIGNGTSLHLAGAQFALAAGVNQEHAPYRKTGAANADLIAGRVEVMFQTVSAAAEAVRAGRMRALAVTSAERAPGFAEVPALREAGADPVPVGFFGLWSPAGVPGARRAALEPIHPDCRQGGCL